MPGDVAADGTLAGTHRIEGYDVLGQVARSPVPARIARREKLVALREEAMALVRAESLVEARGIWRMALLEGEPGAAGWLCVDGEHLDAPWLVPESGRLTAVACAVLTIGPAIDERIRTLFDARQASLALALDGVANEMVFALSRRVQDHLLATVRRDGLTVAGELRAGDPGLALQAQSTVLKLAGAAAIGVDLTSTLMMRPTKSASIVQGVGVDLPAAKWARCDTCRSRDRCTLASV